MQKIEQEISSRAKEIREELAGGEDMEDEWLSIRIDIMLGRS